MSFKNHKPAEADRPPPRATTEAAWRNLTEDLIFAAAYAEDPRTGSITWRRCLDARKIRYNPEDEHRKCRKLRDAINAKSPHLKSQIERAHAANDCPAFRHAQSALLPEHP